MVTSDEWNALALIRALERIAEFSVSDQPASQDIDEAVWIMKHVSMLRRIAQEALDEDKKWRHKVQEPKREICGYCGTWRSKPCGEGCVFGIVKNEHDAGFHLKENEHGK